MRDDHREMLRLRRVARQAGAKGQADVGEGQTADSEDESGDEDGDRLEDTVGAYGEQQYKGDEGDEGTDNDEDPDLCAQRDAIALQALRSEAMSGMARVCESEGIR